jgi:5-methylcytosine-specific restriction endonuclease McrA
MGMPMSLSAKFADEQSVMSEVDIAIQAMCAGADYGEQIFEVLNKKSLSKKVTRFEHVIWCFIKARWIYLEMRRHRAIEPDELDRVPGKLYVGLLESAVGAYAADFREVVVPRYCMDRLEKSNREREELDRQRAIMASKITRLRNKVYASRCFPAHLRTIIFERDEYRCRNCLRGRTYLEKVGLHLEVDHIVPFVDGGKTTYSNGITLCCECNSAKHHTKGYMDALVRLGVGKI